MQFDGGEHEVPVHAQLEFVLADVHNASANDGQSPTAAQTAPPQAHRLVVHSARANAAQSPRLTHDVPLHAH